LMIEILTGVLSGGLLSHECARVDSTGMDGDSSKFFLAINPERFLPAERFAERIDDLLANISAGFAPGQVWYYPGQRGWQARDRYLKERIPIHPRIVEQLQAMGITLPAA
jgi:L-2-hydroxycarboxylate dehydrogenase (NAD+)